MSREGPTKYIQSIPTEQDRANLESLSEGHEYAATIGPEDEFALAWTAEETQKTGRSPWDVLDEPSEECLINYSERRSLDGVWEWPTVAHAIFLEECHLDKGFAEAMIDETLTANHWEREVRRIWHRLWTQDAIFPGIADVLMVLIAETELLVRPRYTTEHFKGGVQRQFEWEGVTDLHQHSNRLWTKVLRGANATVVETEYDELCNKYPVLPYLAVCQKSILLYLLERRDRLIEHAKVAEFRWQQTERRNYTSHPDTTSRTDMTKSSVPMGESMASDKVEVGNQPYAREGEAPNEELRDRLQNPSDRLAFIAELHIDYFSSGGWKGVRLEVVKRWKDAGLSSEKMPKYLRNSAALTRTMAKYWKRRREKKPKDAE